MSDPVTSPRPSDAGFSLVELLVALAIFSLLAGVVSVVVVNGVQAIARVSTANQVQAEQQNAMLWVTRLLRYVDNPVSGSTPPESIVSATPTSMVFFTLSGTGTADRLAYKALLCTSTRGVESFLWAPAVTNGVPAAISTALHATIPSCDDAGGAGASRRLLLPIEPTHTPSLSLRYYATAAGVDTELVPVGSLSATQLDELAKVTVSLSDSSIPVPLEQTVLLVNPR
ncbi:MAG: prepilin-type N-terminal cleavage/methylation domain-containing protein [Actinomycetota bacterium]|nr:prepilin-type N-terminal cleavage/methylation domain-containing protein [Actinomycetota bacterium]